MCASAARARLAAVTFTYNGTGGLQNLHVETSYPKYFGKEETTLWAVEDTQMKIAQIDPLWGVIGENYEHLAGLSTIRREYIWIPAGMNTIEHGFQDTLISPGLSGGVLRHVYSKKLNKQYFGATDWRLLNAWNQIGSNGTGIADMINLMYVNQVAQFAVGSKSVLNAKGQEHRPIQLFRNVVVYNPTYGIPVITLFSVLCLSERIKV